MQKDKQISVITTIEFSFSGYRELEITSLFYKFKINVHIE